jgi:N-methylhydantoinase B
MSYRFTEAGSISIHDDRWFIPPWGVNGGLPAQRSWKLLQRTDGSEQHLPAKCDGIAVQPGDLLHFVTWGAGGWGDPLERDAALVALEVERGLVSVQGALDYGVVIGAQGRLDTAATEALRQTMRSQREPLAVFNRGPDIAELRQSCQAETGLPPPSPPVWQVAA